MAAGLGKQGVNPGYLTPVPTSLLSLLLMLRQLAFPGAEHGSAFVSWLQHVCQKAEAGKRGRSANSALVSLACCAPWDLPEKWGFPDLFTRSRFLVSLIQWWEVRPDSTSDPGLWLASLCLSSRLQWGPKLKFL